MVCRVRSCQKQRRKRNRRRKRKKRGRGSEKRKRKGKMKEEELAEIIKLSNWPGKAGPIPLTQTVLQKQKKMLHGPCQDRFEDGGGK